MKFTGVGLIAFIFVSILVCLRAGQSRAQQDSGYPAASVSNEDAVLGYLGPALHSARKSARLYYRGVCEAADTPTPSVLFPITKAQQPSKDKKGLAAVRQIFEGDKGVTVNEESSGIIRIRIGEVPSEILQTNLPLLKLDKTDRYSPRGAIFAIERTSELQAAMHRLGFHLPKFFESLESTPRRGMPHLPSSMKNITVEQALDLVAIRFRGIVVYGECPGPERTDLFWISFTDLVRYENHR